MVTAMHRIIIFHLQTVSDLENGGHHIFTHSRELNRLAMNNFDFDQSFMKPSLEKFPQEELHQAPMLIHVNSLFFNFTSWPIETDIWNYDEVRSTWPMTKLELASLVSIMFNRDSLRPPQCRARPCPQATGGQTWFLYGALALIALGTGGIKPCVLTFGADQLDEVDKKEVLKKYVFFNLFFLAINMGALFGITL
ncbi:hypothetical protein OIU78_021674 [Salix suchowensis]|nr:hypothetical protein OIU78_021674 [Salix suchowensis]